MDKIPSLAPQSLKFKPPAISIQHSPLTTIRLWGRFVVNIVQHLYSKGLRSKFTVTPHRTAIDKRSIQHVTSNENSGKAFTLIKANKYERDGQFIKAVWLRLRAHMGMYLLPTMKSQHFQKLGQGAEGRADLVFKGFAGKFEVKKTPFNAAKKPDAEITLLNRLDHSNIVKISPDAPDTNTKAGEFHMQNGGVPLKKLKPSVATPTHASRPLIVSIARQLADTLAYLKKERVLHRDIKPDNIVIDQAGHITLIDFGLAYDCKARVACSRGGIGTLNYMPPDTLNRKGIRVTYSRTADMFAAGQTLLELLSGKVLRFPGFLQLRNESEEEAWNRYKQDSETLATLDRIAPQVAQALKDEPQEYIDAVTDVLKRMLHPDPKQRITPEELQKHPLLAMRRISL